MRKRKRRKRKRRRRRKRRKIKEKRKMKMRKKESDNKQSSLREYQQLENSAIRISKSEPGMNPKSLNQFTLD